MSEKQRTCENLPKKVYIRTFGCQMNDRDSEALLGLFLRDGYRQENSEKDADVILVNTCSVRDHAENRALSFLGSLKKLKTYNLKLMTKPVIGLIGCMAKNKGDEVFAKMPHVDLVCGPAAFFRLPAYIKEIQDQGSRIKDLDDRERDESFYGAVFRESRDHAQVVISTGCSNYCSYCVVPYTRGKLRPRSPESIMAEIKENIKIGRKKITLLGQNVNDYKILRIKDKGKRIKERGKGGKETIDFVGLLREIDKIEGLEELDFVTSNPKNTSEELFKVMAESKKIKKHLHLPFQSGSNRILKLMGRGYSREKYIELAAQYREITGGTLGTDIIIGFPTESEEDFKQTVDLVKEVKFKYAFIFKYSPRLVTKAAKMKDDVSESIKKKRHKKLLDLQKKISKTI